MKTGCKDQVILKLAEKCSSCRILGDYMALVDEIKQVIPFRGVCSAVLFIGSYNAVHMEWIVWFRSIPKLEKFWLEEKLHEIDPLLKYAFEAMESQEELIQLLWEPIYKASLKNPKWRTAEFLAKLIPFGFDASSGCTWLFRINPNRYFLFGYEGEVLEEYPPEIETVLIPAMAKAYERVGRGQNRSWKR